MSNLIEKRTVDFEMRWFVERVTGVRAYRITLKVDL